MAIVSWVFWFAWMAAGLVYELYAVRSEKKTGALPLTRVVRDRLMKRSWVIRIGVLTFLSWIFLHFVTNVSW